MKNTWAYKDLRISTLAFFRDLTDIKDVDERLKKAMELSNRLYEEFSEPENDLAKPIEKPKKVEPLLDEDGNEVPF